ncbi:acyl-[acyl-carrier-protein]-phospholipid O-acyltransferase / long-chain-fatty-acid--[acyl-carrier-protein] ligase [Sporolactobacillus nakayamae]|uniref:Acyl-[acyl-carrier-protein]-phospholipid O-acyltransferase / long-chain-fatty-acid--[acyl-carrier-protein] ligase n=1 Tax=Sporolactobacillus nakayamae TaxID=269670 RepID=A0A1I2PML2_9BACL|nr:acyl-[acyl-carrier-protein]-phospholipid O-acyltransferase / long-chain-fatty-acid--[acyl-carrier-protein] ligase [Sporolactobacillus nakayamae]
MTLQIPEDVNLYDELVKQAKAHPKKVVIEDTSSSYTYSKFLIAVTIMSKKLEQTIGNDKRVGLYLPNVVGQVIVLFGLFKNEQTPCLLNFTMGTTNIIDCIETASLGTVITSREFVKKADLGFVVEEMEKQVKVIYLEDLARGITTFNKITGLIETRTSRLKKKAPGEVILFTSGTESKPKGVVLTHRNIYANIMQVFAHIEIQENDRIFNPLPLFHSFGMTVGSILPFVTGTKTYLFPSPLAFREIPKAIHKDKSTIFVATNTFFENYAKFATKEQFQTLRIVVAGAEKLQNDVRKTYHDKFGITILDGYGATETSPIISLNTHQFYKVGTVGKLIPLMEAKIAKVEGVQEGGNLMLKGPNVMKGYLIHGQGFVPSGEWYNTGDIAEIDEDGFIHIIGRLKRFAKIAGEMISLNKVEELALECFGESKFYAVCIPDKRKGEQIVMFTTKSKVSSRDLKKFIKSKKMSMLYMPASIEIVDEIPLLGSGKPNYWKLEKLAKNQ